MVQLVSMVGVFTMLAVALGVIAMTLRGRGATIIAALQGRHFVTPTTFHPVPAPRVRAVIRPAPRLYSPLRAAA